MSDVFAEYVTLVDDVEQIPAVARRCPTLSAAERAATVAQVTDMVRHRVLPQSDRQEAGLAALFDDDTPRAASAPAGDHDAIVAAVDELEHADPENGPLIQQLLYRLHDAIAGHFGETEVILAGAVAEELPPRRRITSPTGWGAPGEPARVGPSYWFG